MRFTLLTHVLFLTSLAGLAAKVRAAHTTCSWKPVPDDGNVYGEQFKDWCKAERSNDNVYRCGGDAVRGVGNQVADWGKIAPNTLELGKFSCASNCVNSPADTI